MILFSFHIFALVQLMEILENEDHKEIISWLPAGRSFMIHKKNDLEKEVLPKYFQKQSKYSSFTRKLNRWGFQRVARGPETGAYFHRLFRRGEYRLCMRMSCSHKSTPVATTAANERTAEPFASYTPGSHAPYYAAPFQVPYASLPPHYHGQSGPPVGPPMQQAPFADPHYVHQQQHRMYPYPSQALGAPPYSLHHHKYVMENYSGGADPYHLSDYPFSPDVNQLPPHGVYEYEQPISSSYREWNDSVYAGYDGEHHLADTHGRRERNHTVSDGGDAPHATMVNPNREASSMMPYTTHHQRLHADEEYSEHGSDDNLKHPHGYQN
jgi:hypothetical protein